MTGGFGSPEPAVCQTKSGSGPSLNCSKAPSPNRVRIALALTAIFLFALVLSIALFNNPLGSDFSALYAAGLIARKGHASRLYDLNEQAEVEKNFGRDRLLVYAQPPFETVFFAPLTELSYPVAYVVWGAINVLLWVFFQHFLRPAAPVPSQPYQYLMLCSFFLPLWIDLIQGQVALLLLTMFSLAFVFLKRRQDYKAGLFVGLGLFKFPVVLPFALICFLSRKWRLMAGFATSALLLSGLSFVVVGPAGIYSYVKMLFDAITNPRQTVYAQSLKPSDTATLRGFFVTLWPNINSYWILAAAGIAGAILILATAWAWRRHDRYQGEHSPGPLFAAALAVSLATAPHALIHDLTLMILATLLALGSLDWTSKRSWSLVLAICIGILYFPPAYIPLLERHELALLCPVLVCFALATLRLSKLASPAHSTPEPLSASTPSTLCS